MTQPFPPGHFYSPVPDLDEIRRNEGRIWTLPKSLPGIALDEDGQIERLKELSRLFDPSLILPANEAIARGLRYHGIGPTNGSFAEGDAIVLQAMIRLLQPKRIIEIGSGLSSAVMLDTIERYSQDTSLTCVEPYTDLLFSRLKPTDGDKLTLRPERVQDVPLSVFQELGPRDILFIDSTHVCKVGSDVNRLVLDIIPSLHPGVVIHFHDMLWPFEYFKEWVYRGWWWTEAYLVRALLTHNPRLTIVVFLDYLAKMHTAVYNQLLPQAKCPGGSLWLMVG